MSYDLQELNDQSSNNTASTSQIETSNTKEPTKEIISLKKKLEFKIIKLLNSSERDNTPFCQLSVDISKKLYIFLKSKYNLTNEFQRNSRFSQDFDLVQKRFFNSTDYTDVKEETIKIKLYRERNLKFFTDSALNTKILKSLPKIKVRFIRWKNVLQL